MYECLIHCCSGCDDPCCYDYWVHKGCEDYHLYWSLFSYTYCKSAATLCPVGVRMSITREFKDSLFVNIQLAWNQISFLSKMYFFVNLDITYKKFYNTLLFFIPLIYLLFLSYIFGDNFPCLVLDIVTFYMLVLTRYHHKLFISGRESIMKD